MPTVSGIVVPTGGCEADGRRLFRDVLDELSRPVNASDETVRALAAESFRAAVRVMNRKGLWPWEILQEDLNITQNVTTSPVSCAVKKQLRMKYLTGGSIYQPIDYVAYDKFVESCDIYLNNTAQPCVYTIPNLFETGLVQWYPTPDANYTARFNFYRVTPAPRLEDEAIEIPDYAIEVYMSRAWYELSKRLTSGQRPMQIDVAMAEWRLAFREISSHIASPGDRSRWVGNYGGW